MKGIYTADKGANYAGRVIFSNCVSTILYISYCDIYVFHYIQIEKTKVVSFDGYKKVCKI